MLRMAQTVPQVIPDKVERLIRCIRKGFLTSTLRLSVGDATSREVCKLFPSLSRVKPLSSLSVSQPMRHAFDAVVLTFARCSCDYEVCGSHSWEMKSAQRLASGPSEVRLPKPERDVCERRCVGEPYRRARDVTFLTSCR